MTARHKTNGVLKKNIEIFMRENRGEYTVKDISKIFCCDQREMGGIMKRLHYEGKVYRVRRENNGTVWRAY